MKISKSKLNKIIKEELESVSSRLHDTRANREGTPPWYSDPGGVADRLQEMAEEIQETLDEHDGRLVDLEEKAGLQPDADVEDLEGDLPIPEEPDMVAEARVLKESRMVQELNLELEYEAFQKGNTDLLHKRMRYHIKQADRKQNQINNYKKNALQQGKPLTFVKKMLTGAGATSKFMMTSYRRAAWCAMAIGVITGRPRKKK